MGVRFCPNCGTRLMPSKEGDADFLVCPRCGFKARSEGSTLIPVSKVERSLRDKITVIRAEEGEMRTFPIVSIECPKCGNTEAYFWTVQTRSSDEASTQFFRCTRCGHTWREYG